MAIWRWYRPINGLMCVLTKHLIEKEHTFNKNSIKLRSCTKSKIPQLSYKYIEPLWIHILNASNNKQIGQFTSHRTQNISSPLTVFGVFMVCACYNFDNSTDFANYNFDCSPNFSLLNFVL